MLGVAGAWELTNKLKSPYIFRSSWANGQAELAGGWYAYNKLGMKRMIVLAPDFVGGHEKADAFIKTFKAAGGQVVEAIKTIRATGATVAKVIVALDRQEGGRENIEKEGVAVEAVLTKGDLGM